MSWVTRLPQNSVACIPLPGRLRHSGDLPAQRQFTEAQAAEAELAQISPRTSATLAAVVPTRRKLRSLRLVGARNLKLLFDLCVFYSLRCSHEILKNLVSSFCIFESSETYSVRNGVRRCFKRVRAWLSFGH